VSDHAVALNTKTYADGAVATRNRRDLIVQVRIAKTGVVFKETRLQGSVPPDFSASPANQMQIMGESMHYPDLERWLSLLLYTPTLTTETPGSCLTVSPDDASFAVGFGNGDVNRYRMNNLGFIKTNAGDRAGDAPKTRRTTRPWAIVKIEESLANMLY
jgi:hypothetical protein